jgi:hypothetical protein
MWLEIEGDILVNLELVERVEFQRHRGTATLYSGNMHLCGESRIAFAYFNSPGVRSSIVSIQSGQEKPAA